MYGSFVGRLLASGPLQLSILVNSLCKSMAYFFSRKLHQLELLCLVLTAMLGIHTFSFTGPCKMKRVQARDLAGGSEISRNYAAWRASADFSVLLRDPRDLRVKGRAQSYSRRKRGTLRNYANSYLGI